MGKSIRLHNIISNILTVFLLIAFLLLLFAWYRDNSGLRHCVTVPKDALTSFSPEDEQKLFEVFNIVVPENEIEVYVQSFSRRYDDFLGYTQEVFYAIEIGGVRDYEAFYAANTGRIGENGLEGKAMNQILDNGSNYYISYVEYFVDDPRLLKEDNKQEKFDKYNEIYENLIG